METALRGALAKGDVSDPLFRRKVYEAAANAMHRSLEKKGNAPEEAFDQQKRRLADAIRTIEADLKAPPKPQAPVAPAPVKTAPPVEPTATKTQSADDLREKLKLRESQNQTPDVAPDSDAKKTRLYVEPKVERGPEPPETESVSEKKIRAPYAKFLTGAVAVALLGIGLLWIINTGAFQSAEERDTSVPNPEQVLESESFEGRDPGTANAPQTIDTREQDVDGWVTMFTPADPTVLGLVGGATASVESDLFGTYARLTTPSEQAQIQIDVPRSILNQARGKMLQISLRARSDEGKPTQISVTCDLGALGNCGRRRFDVGQAENEFIFQIDLSQSNDSSTTGILKIDTDLRDHSRAIKLLDARIRVLES